MPPIKRVVVMAPEQGVPIPSSVISNRLLIEGIQCLNMNGLSEADAVVLECTASKQQMFAAGYFRGLQKPVWIVNKLNDRTRLAHQFGCWRVPDLDKLIEAIRSYERMP